jgi:NAD(P)-dependent dehydrogenase (short-subunit alcohol dehydrogenase family)
VVLPWVRHIFSHKAYRPCAHASVRNFAKAWGDRPIDALCLNAGVAWNTRDKTPRSVSAKRATRFVSIFNPCTDKNDPSLNRTSSLQEIGHSSLPCPLPGPVMITQVRPLSWPHRFTREGFEETIGVNHLGHFLLAEKLLSTSALAYAR